MQASSIGDSRICPASAGPARSRAISASGGGEVAAGFFARDEQARAGARQLRAGAAAHSSAACAGLDGLRERMRRRERVVERDHHRAGARQQPRDGRARVERAGDEGAAVQVQHQRRAMRRRDRA